MTAYRVVSFDIDGTLTLGHGWFYISSALGRLDDYAATTAGYRAGMIGEDEHLSNLLNIAAGSTTDEIVKILETIPLIENIAKGIQLLKDEGMRTYLLTHNPGYVCLWYQEAFGLDGFRCSRQAVRKGRICRAPNVHADKIGWLGEICRAEGLVPANVVHVGDSDSDAAVFRQAGIGIAVNAGSRSARDVATLAINTSDMMDIVLAVASGSKR